MRGDVQTESTGRLFWGHIVSVPQQLTVKGYFINTSSFFLLNILISNLGNKSTTVLVTTHNVSVLCVYYVCVVDERMLTSVNLSHNQFCNCVIQRNCFSRWIKSISLIITIITTQHCWTFTLTTPMFPSCQTYALPMNVRHMWAKRCCLGVTSLLWSNIGIWSIYQYTWQWNTASEL